MCRIAVVSVHTSPLAKPGTRDSGGMNVYIRELSREMGRRANTMDIFTRRVRAFFIFVVPVGAMAHVPASLVLGKWSVAEGLLASAWAILMGAVVFRAWRWSFRRYESAMG